MPPFHLAFPVDDLAAARAFYVDLLGCAEGRSADRWIDLDFFGHQITAHLADDIAPPHHNPVDGDAVPIPHFGAILSPEAFAEIAERLTAANTDFIIPPRTRFAGQPGEQSTMFLRDPAGNAIEFKAMRDADAIFTKA
ncbi:MAG: VOC family protein [Pacificimonas sp.]|jgi:extradiol dioxygenase family protein|nr:VOC family protein [Pacificimonas sp.]